MAYSFDYKCCGTCFYWKGKRNFPSSSSIDFDLNEKGNCGRYGGGGEYLACSGACSWWKGAR